jgi:predicted ATPase
MQHTFSHFVYSTLKNVQSIVTLAFGNNCYCRFDYNCLVAVGENGSGKSSILYGEYLLVILTAEVLKCNITGLYLFPHI